MSGSSPRAINSATLCRHASQHINKHTCSQTFNHNAKGDVSTHMIMHTIAHNQLQCGPALHTENAQAQAGPRKRVRNTEREERWAGKRLQMNEHSLSPLVTYRRRHRPTPACRQLRFRDPIPTKSSLLPSMASLPHPPHPVRPRPPHSSSSPLHQLLLITPTPVLRVYGLNAGLWG